MRADLLHHRLAVARLRLVHAQDHAGGAQRWVESRGHQLHGAEQLLQTSQRQVLRLHGHEHLVRGGERIHAEHAKARRAIEQDHVEAIGQRGQRVAQHALHTIATGKFAFHQGQLGVGGNEREVVATLHHAVGGLGRRIGEQRAGGGPAVVGLHAEVQRQVGLRIHVHQQRAKARGGQTGAQIHRGGGLADAALLVQKRDDARAFGAGGHGPRV